MENDSWTPNKYKYGIIFKENTIKNQCTYKWK